MQLDVTGRLPSGYPQYIVFDLTLDLAVWCDRGFTAGILSMGSGFSPSWARIALKKQDTNICSQNTKLLRILATLEAKNTKNWQLQDILLNNSFNTPFFKNLLNLF